MKLVCIRLGRYCLYPGPNKYETIVFTAQPLSFINKKYV